MTKIGLRATVLALPVAFAAGGALMAADFTLGVNTALTTGDPLYKGLEAFRDMVAEDSGGRLEIKLYPNSQLGPDEVALTVPVDDGTVFPGLARGARVAVYGTSFPGQAASVTRLLADAATVFDVDTARTGIGLGDGAAAGPISSVTLLVPRTLAADIAHAQVNGMLTLALAPGEGPP